MSDGTQPTDRRAAPAATGFNPLRLAMQVGFTLAFLGAGGAAFAALMASSVKPSKAAEAPGPPPVEVVVATSATMTAVVHATGTVQPATRIDLVPQVSGRVVEMFPGLTPGARVSANEQIARIDPRDYQSAIVQAEAAVAAARLEVALEENRGDQASREFELLKQAPGSELARRELQLAAARANLASAEARLQSARVNLERTRLTAPFDAVVLTESLDLGQVVAPGVAVASLMGTARFRVRVAVPVSELDVLDIPTGSDGHGSRAMVHQRLDDGTSLEREGFVLRMLGELDAETRTAAVLVALDDPLNVPEGQTPILPGAFVDVEIDGRSTTSLFALPREALRDGAYLWVLDAEDRLVRRDVVPQRTTSAAMYLRDGVTDGERVVVSALPHALAGMHVAPSVAAPAGAVP